MTRCSCESPTLSPIKTIPLFIPEDCVLKSTLRVVECSSCGFIFTDTDQSQEDYDLYYSRQNMYYKPVTEITKYITDIFDVSHKYLNSESTIIDIGCGGGSLLTLFKNKGYTKVTGVDTSKVCVEHLHANEISCIHGSVFSVNPTQFDYVTCCHVLEHIIDINGFVTHLKKFMKPDGHMYIEVPDSSRYTTNPPFQDFNIEHVNHFTHMTLVSLFDIHGFQCIESGQKIIGRDYPSVYAIFRMKNSINNYVTESERVFEQIIETIPHEPLCLWGIGQFAYKLLPALVDRGYNVTTLVDDSPFKRGQVIHGLTITDKIPEGVKIIVTSTSGLKFLEKSANVINILETHPVVRTE